MIKKMKNYEITGREFDMSMLSGTPATTEHKLYKVCSRRLPQSLQGAVKMLIDGNTELKGKQVVITSIEEVCSTYELEDSVFISQATVKDVAKTPVTL